MFKTQIGSFRDVLKSVEGVYRFQNLEQLAINVIRIWVSRHRHIGMYIFSNKIIRLSSVNPYGKSPELEFETVGELKVGG